MTDWILRHTGLSGRIGWPNGIAFDRVVLALLAALALLAVIDASQAGRSLVFTLESLVETAPYLIGSIAIAARSSSASRR